MRPVSLAQIRNICSTRLVFSTVGIFYGETVLMARISDKDRKPAQTLTDPVLWGQAYLGNRDGIRRIYWPHQVEDLFTAWTNTKTSCWKADCAATILVE